MGSFLATFIFPKSGTNLCIIFHRKGVSSVLSVHAHWLPLLKLFGFSLPLLSLSLFHCLWVFGPPKARHTLSLFLKSSGVIEMRTLFIFPLLLLLPLAHRCGNKCWPISELLPLSGGETFFPSVGCNREREGRERERNLCRGLHYAKQWKGSLRVKKQIEETKSSL